MFFPQIFPEHLETERLLKDPEYMLVGVSMSRDLEGKHYYFSPTADYDCCPHCLSLMELQCDAYGNYMEGPGHVVFSSNPRELRCPQCLQIVAILPDRWWIGTALFEMEGFSFVHESGNEPLEYELRIQGGCQCNICGNRGRCQTKYEPCKCNTCNFPEKESTDFYCQSQRGYCHKVIQEALIHAPLAH